MDMSKYWILHEHQHQQEGGGGEGRRGGIREEGKEKFWRSKSVSTIFNQSIEKLIRINVADVNRLRVRLDSSNRDWAVRLSKEAGTRTIECFKCQRVSRWWAVCVQICYITRSFCVVLACRCTLSLSQSLSLSLTAVHVRQHIFSRRS